MRSLSAPFISLVLYLGVANAACLHARSGPRAISVHSHTELGPLIQNSYVTGRDNGQSATMNGKSYWFFDDTTMTNGFISNTGAVTTDMNASDNIQLTSTNWTSTDSSQRPGYLIPLTSAEVDWQNKHAKDGSGNCKLGSSDPFCAAQYALWPAAVFADPDRDRIIIGYGKLCRVSSGSKCNGPLGQYLGWGFYEVNVDTGIGAKLTPSTGGGVDATGVDDPALFGVDGTFGFTTGAVVYDGDVYIYGGGSALVGTYLAKAPLDAFTDMSKWTYWDGTSYQGDKTKLKGTIAPGAAGNTVFYSSSLGGFYNAFMPYGTNAMYMQSASKPEGPWSPWVKLFDSEPSGKDANYAGFAHPEYASSDGLTQYITYYQPGTGDQRLVKVVLN